jgi:hypothetical protein
MRDLPPCGAFSQPTAPSRDTLCIEQFLQQNTHTTQMLALLRMQSTRTHTLYDVLNM